jgi:hypothetical protein
VKKIKPACLRFGRDQVKKESRACRSAAVEAGMIHPGAWLVAANGNARVRADGSLALGDATGSSIARRLPDAPACNGWTFWSGAKQGPKLMISSGEKFAVRWRWRRALSASLPEHCVMCALVVRARTVAITFVRHIRGSNRRASPARGLRNG